MAASAMVCGGVNGGLNSDDISSSLSAAFSPGSTWRDDGDVPLPTTYSRLREGIERFFITDINNPAASAQAQSNIAVMWDAWATDANVFSGAPTGSASALFNHIPGGSNVLYMDGHVSFVRYNSAYPIESKSGPGTSLELRQHMSIYAPLCGGFE